MRTVGISMMFALLVSGAAACGGDDGGSDNTNTDNNNDDDNTDDITVDDTSADMTDDNTDNTPLPDASTGGGGAEAIGKVCVLAMNGADCPPAAPSCVALVQGTNGFCTAACGTSADNMTPPANGNATCAAVTPAVPSGTVACGLYGEAMNGMVPWACGIFCGTIDNMGTPQDLGMCPTGLTCTQNLCQP